MSASSQIAVLLENEVLVASPESDAIQVEGSEWWSGRHPFHPKPLAG